MYNSIQNLDNSTLIKVVHFAIKILNKYKYKNIPIELMNWDKTLSPADLLICQALLSEIGIENLMEKTEQLEFHIQELYKYLIDKISFDESLDFNRGKNLLLNLRKIGELQLQ